MRSATKARKVPANKAINQQLNAQLVRIENGEEIPTEHAGLRIVGEYYGNSLLTRSIATGHNAAAIQCALACRQQDLDLFDTFPSSQSTALIMAAKTGATKVAILLLCLGANPNAQDFNGYSALHYACILRMNHLIQALLDSGARRGIRNDHGRTARFYYNLDINEVDMSYHHGCHDSGKKKHQVRVSYDWGKSFIGTRMKDLSALRWFLPYIIKNSPWNAATTANSATIVGPLKHVMYDFEKKAKKSVDIHFNEINEVTNVSQDQTKNLADYYARRHIPTMDIRVHQALSDRFLFFRRQAHNPEISRNLHSLKPVAVKLGCL